MGINMSSDGAEISEKQSKYDVFLSFRGADTRWGFTDELYHALQNAGIKTFRDDNELRRGEDIATELLTSIPDSIISLIIFSRNYADSRWCLEELAKIMECRESIEDYMIFPIFYHVDPSDVRNQTGSFQGVFAQHEKRFGAEKVSRWRCALTDAANLSGWHIMDDSCEGDGIKTIVKEVSASLQTVFEFEGCQTEEIGQLNRMVELKIYNLEQVKNREEADRAKLKEKKYLSKLVLKWSTLEWSWSIFRVGSNDEDVLESFEPHPNLKSLTITNYGGEKFPSWLMKMRSINSKGDLLLHHNLVELKLDSCTFVQQLPTLGQLPLLKILEMEHLDVKTIDKEFCGDGASSSNESSSAFPSLQRLSLVGMDNLVEWMIPDSPQVMFPCLEELHVEGCPKLKSVPDYFLSLRYLEISGLKSQPDQTQSSNSELKSQPDKIQTANRKADRLSRHKELEEEFKDIFNRDPFSRHKFDKVEEEFKDFFNS